MKGMQRLYLPRNYKLAHPFGQLLRKFVELCPQWLNRAIVRVTTYAHVYVFPAKHTDVTI